MLNNQQDAPTVKWASKPLFGDVPTLMGMVYLNMALTWLYSIARGGSNLGANVTRTDPGAGGGGNATVTSQHADRNQSSREAVLSLIEIASNLYYICSRAPFNTGADIWAYLNSTGVVYLRIPDDQAQEEIRKVQQWTIKDLPVTLQNDENVSWHFYAKIQGYNPMLHPNMNISNQMKITIFCNGLHPEAKVVALQQKNNLATAAANGCCFPATWPAGHPNAGVAHPQAGQLSLRDLCAYVDTEFKLKIHSGLVRLKGQPGVFQIQATDVPDRKSVV